MNRIFAFALLFVALISKAQYLDTKGFTNDYGIKWTKGYSWEQIKAKAKEVNKYIFIDCYASWCGPCKVMDRKVYSSKEVGDFFNKNFISFKIQMDTSKVDGEEIKKYYSDAQKIMSQYTVNAFPSFLFLNPDGEIVHRGVGYYSPQNLIALGSDALNPQKQYYTLVSGYLNGKKDTSVLKDLALRAQSVGDTTLAKKIARDYIDMLGKEERLTIDNIKFIRNVLRDIFWAKNLAQAYIGRLKKEELFSKENILFISDFTKSSKDVGFSRFYFESDEINRLMGEQDYAESVLCNIITKEEIYSELSKHWKRVGKKVVSEPNWDSLKSIIKLKYNEYYANRTITYAKVKWYEKTLNWQEYTKNLVLFFEKYDSDKSVWKVNNTAWIVFQKANSKELLNKALSWMEKIKNENPTYSNIIDTYANLLYKVGRVEEAILWEEKVVLLSTGEKEFVDTLNKMKRKEPTWENEKIIK